MAAQVASRRCDSTQIAIRRVFAFKQIIGNDGRMLRSPLSGTLFAHLFKQLALAYHGMLMISITDPGMYVDIMYLYKNIEG
ncbi:MAG: hypothetical protein RBT11_04040 [Desulfobacterales bacterium]|jgi:hypothetical protein|nr:hypothetical protein [Desulfobacterales bacterium]